MSITSELYITNKPPFGIRDRGYNGLDNVRGKACKLN